MGKLIDAGTTKKALKECGLWFVADISCDIVDNQPAVDAVPVVHAHWIEHETHIGSYYACSNCGNTQILFGSNYCPYCGAKMYKVEHEKTD